MRRLALLILLVSSAAHADRFVGARIGGYGFRRPATDGGRTAWDDCRMNGVGVFAQQGLPLGTFVELGLDAYFGDDFGTPGAPPAMDRVSGLTTLAGGVRGWPGGVFSPYVQLGLGLELTRVVIDGRDGNYALPLGFFGIGGDVRVGRFRLGASLRVHAMGKFEGALDPEPELASQAQFYAMMSL
jgi:hypothetical protein